MKAHITITKTEAEAILTDYFENRENFEVTKVSIEMPEKAPLSQDSDLLTANKIFLVKFCREFVRLTHNASRAKAGSPVPVLFDSIAAVEQLIERVANKDTRNMGVVK